MITNKPKKKKLSVAQQAAALLILLGLAEEVSHTVLDQTSSLLKDVAGNAMMEADSSLWDLTQIGIWDATDSVISELMTAAVAESPSFTALSAANDALEEALGI